MNIVYKVTLRHLKKNKKRTLVTMIGVIISVAMITGTATLASSLLDFWKNQALASKGNWHVLYKDVNKDQLEAIQDDAATKELVVSQEGFAKIKIQKNFNKPYLFIKAYNAQGFKDFPVKLNEGRLPQRANELVISEEVAANAGIKYHIGDQLTLDVGQRVDKRRPGLLTQNDNVQIINGRNVETLTDTRTRTYTIVGFIETPSWEPRLSSAYTAISCLDESMAGEKSTVNASVVLSRINRSLFPHAEYLAETNKIKSVEFNNDLLRYYNVVNDSFTSSFYSVSTIVMIVILIGSVALTYNAFAISVSDRIRYLGMLSSLGATRKQKRSSVFFEGAIIGIISIPLGIMGGLIGVAAILWSFNGRIQNLLKSSEMVTSVKVHVSLAPISLLIAAAISMLTICISIYIPAQKASKISAIDAIRQTADIKLKGKTVRTSKFMRRLFGIAGEIGLKNLKRNKRGYYGTVFSLSISIVLFLTVSYFTSNMDSFYKGVLNQGLTLDISSIQDPNQYDQVVKSIVSLEDVTEYNLINRVGGEWAWISPASLSHEWIENSNNKIDPKGKYQISVVINAFTDERLEAYAQEVGVDDQQLKDINHPSAIVINTMGYHKEGRRQLLKSKLLNSESGNVIDIENPNHRVHTFKIAALTDRIPAGLVDVSFNIVISKQVLDQLNEKNVGKDLYLSSRNPLKTAQEIKNINSDIYDMNPSISSTYENMQNLLLIKQFGFGFVALITVISMANIFNTISTSISLRRREFAMLRSMGMEPKSFNKMIQYESVFYEIMSLAYGLPISVLIMYLMYKVFTSGYLSRPDVPRSWTGQLTSQVTNGFDYGFILPWSSVLITIVAVFAIVSITMLYASARVQKENIIDALKQENR